MALQAHEVKRTFEQGTDNPSGTREFLVVEDDPTAGEPTFGQVSGATGIRLFTPDKQLGGSSPPLGRLIPLELSISSESDGFGQYSVKYKYGLDTVTGPDTSPGDPSFISFNLNQRPVAVDAWRAKNYTRPTAPNSAGYFDIGGDKIDAAGEPVTLFLNQQDLSITVRAESFAEVPIAASLALVGKRNNVPFSGAGEGQLLYKGMAVARDGVESYNCTFTFTWDEWDHERQVPARDSDGGVITFNYDPNVRARYVELVQPFPDLGDFTTLNIPNPV